VPKRILIAEDETSVRNAIRTFVETRSQFEVCEAIDGNEAIHKAEALKPDLVVLDLRMPIAESAPRLPTTLMRISLSRYTQIRATAAKRAAWKPTT